MNNKKKTVSVLDIAIGAAHYLPDIPRMLPGLMNVAFLRPNSRKSLGLMFQQTTQKHPNRPFLAFADQVWTYDQANRTVNRMARALVTMGIGPGQTVALLAENCPDLLLAVLAVAKTGATSALLNINQQGKVLAHSIGLVKPKVILSSQRGLELLWPLVDEAQDCVSKSEILSFTGGSDALWASDFKTICEGQPDHDLAQTLSIQANSPCFYIFTSGTTGLPKASVMSHYRWIQAMTGMSSAVRLYPDDVFYCCLPLYHNNALTVSLGVVVSSGACFALDEKFSASQFWNRIRHYKATAFCYIGELLRYLMNRPESHNDQNHEVRLIVGNGLRPEIWRAFESRFGIEHIYEFYGASESNLGFMNAFGLKETVGCTPIPYKIVQCDPDTEEPVRNGKGFCKAVKRGDVGLLISEVTTLRPFDGYTDAKANEKKLLRDVFKKGDCWFNSGDLVRDQGWFHIQFVDRLGDTFRWKGENVATSEVEGVVSQLDWVDHAVVYGVQVAGADGRAGMVALSVKPDCELNLDELAKHLKAQLPAYAVPLFVRVTQNPQTTGTFKYQKVQLKKEGFDVAQVADPLFRLNEKQGRFEPLGA